MKNDGSYFLSIGNKDGSKARYEPEVVYSFKWNGVEFFAHKHYLSSGFWQVSDKEFGYSLCLENIKTRETAKKVAIEKLDKVGIDKFKEVTEKIKEGLK